MVEPVHQISEILSKFFDKLIIFTRIAFTASEISFSEKNFQSDLGKDKVGWKFLGYFYMANQ